jgi:NO-binding membrane sensor protein with MHYT domain
VPVGYELLPTLLSLFAATGLSGLGLFLAGRGGRFGVAGWITGSLCAGIGACLMLWLAMEAMALRAELEWNLQAVGAAAAMAMVTASAALWLAFNLRRPAQRVAAAVALGAAFCATHQLGMAAATLVGTKAAPAGRLVIGSSHLDLVVCLAAVVVLLAIHSMLAARAAVASAREQLLRQLHA